MPLEHKKLNLSHPIVVFIFALISCLLWGSAFPCVKIGYGLFCVDTSSTASVMLFAGLRFTLAGILVVGIDSVIHRRLQLPKKSSWGMVVVLSLFQTVVQYALFYVGLANTSGVKSSVVWSLNVFVTIVISAFIFRQEKFTWQKVVGCVLGVTGVALVNLNGLDFSFSFMGEGLLLLSTVSAGFSACFLRVFAKKEDTTVLSGWQFIVGGVVLSVIGLSLGGRITTVSFPAVAMLFYLAVISSVAYTLWGLLLKHNKPSTVASYGFMNPVFGVILSAIILREQLDWVMCITSLLLITLGIFSINLLEEYIQKIKSRAKK